MDVRVAVACILFVLRFGGCQDSANEAGSLQLTEGEEVLLVGRATDVDGTPMFVDGDGLLYLRVEEVGDVTVHVPARERMCPASGLEVFSSIEPGDSVWVRGRVTGPQAMTVCEEATHFLESVE